MSGQTISLLDIYGLTDTKKKKLTDFRLCSCGCNRASNGLGFRSIKTGRFYRSEACFVKKERSGE